ncbi:prepilin-type N-terminal cleavage/methylation domain-containing protein [Marinobacter lacisalsi]|uniref:Prepilin-type N-terminal cleavage/methylation domain-containing protein n=1 Tax=Marinobacter lacisalsi TaxID=475979 RepID=A0ABV8QEJ7_9GAMM
MSSKQKQKGFTLIELVVVIAILAILAAFALPRFAQLSEQAHNSSIQGTAGALSAGVALVKAQWVTNGSTTADTDGVEGFGEGDVAATGDGWPDPNNTGGCAALWEALLQANAPSIATSGTATEYTASFTDPVCTYEYNPNEAGDTITYDYSSGEVEVNFN